MPRKTSGTTKFGWCLDNQPDQHDQCIVTTYSGGVCGCECHTKKSKQKTQQQAPAPQANKVTVSLRPKS